MTSARPAEGNWTPSGAHLVGSIPLADSEEVFRASAAALGAHLRRLPDGETGIRWRWNSWTAPLYERTPGLELVDPPEDNYTPWKQARLAVPADELVFGPSAMRTSRRSPMWCSRR